MRRTATAMMAVAAVLFAAGLSAQGKPNFAGKWTLQVDPNAAPPAGGGGGGRGGGGRGGGGRGMMGGGGFCGAECTITQDATTLKIERPAPAGGEAPAPNVYKLDGSDSKNPGQAFGGNPAPDVVSKASWDGSKIVIKSTRTMNRGGQDMTINSTITISMDGANMVVETSTDMGQGAQAGPKQTYKKS